MITVNLGLIIALAMAIKAFAVATKLRPALAPVVSRERRSRMRLTKTHASVQRCGEVL